MSKDRIQPPRGRIRRHRVEPGVAAHFDRRRGLWLPPGFRPVSGWRPNLVLYDWATLACQLFGLGDRRYRLAVMYFEFENLADPDDPVAAPVFDRGPDSGRAYYDSLSGSSDRDYIRAEIIAPQITSSDDTLFPNGNQLTLFAMATATVGVHGKTYSDSVNSKVFGGALVASPDAADPTQDVVLSRFYLDADEQQLKLPPSQTGLEWELQFE